MSETLTHVNPDGTSVTYESHTADSYSHARIPEDFGVTLGRNVEVHPYARVGRGAVIPSGATLYPRCRVAERADLSKFPGVVFPAGCKVGSDAVGFVVLGYDPRGYCITAYWRKTGGIHITAGCRDFTLAQARRHWRKGHYAKTSSAMIRAMLKNVSAIVKAAKGPRD